MNFLASLKRPEYVFRPAQIVRRVLCSLRKTAPDHETVTLPWGLRISINPHEAQGLLIQRLGVYDLRTCECISRLVDPGDFVVDAGTNIGQMSSLMAMRAGPQGKVIAFEPHPVLFAALQANIANWQHPRAAPITAYNLALSDYDGIARLVLPANFDENQMLAFLADDTATASPERSFEVQVNTLPEFVDEGRPIGFLKLDVEGHELKVLRGAQGLIASSGIRDILFEDHGAPPTPVTEFLAGNGYTLFRISGKLSGPVLTPAEAAFTSGAHGPPNFIATRDPERVMKRMAKRGWTALA
jgi:FkbM family methyltransferase